MKIKGVHAAPALVITVSALLAAIKYADISKISQNTNPYLTLMALELCCIGLPAVFFCLLRQKDFKKRLRLRPMRLRHIPMSVYALAIMICAGISLGVLMYRLFPDAFVKTAMTTASGYMSAYVQTDSIYAALTFGILPAVLEEFLFRGVIMAEYSTYGGICAVLMSSLSFAMLHFDPVRFPVYFVCGIVLGITVGATGSVIPAVIIHTSYNVFVIYFEGYLYKVAGKHSGGMVILLFLVIGALLVFAILFFSSVRKLYERMGEENVPSPLIRKRKEGEAPLTLQALLSPSFLILVVFFTVASLLM